MKTRSRLTALLLALVMALGTAAPALATTIDLAMYQQLVNDAQVEPVIDEGGTLTEAATYIPEQQELPVYQSVTGHKLAVMSADSESTIQVALPEKGKVQLAVDAENGQWQAQMLGQWINLTGETGASCDVTYAKIKSLLDLNGEAKLRWLAADGESASQIAVITLVAAVAAVSTEGTDGEDVPVVAAAQPRMMMMGARAVGAADAPEFTNYDIVINYVFENNEVAADPYTATLAKGSSFSAVVKFPVIQGYLPYVGAAEETSAQIELNISNIQADVTYTVTYKPTLVNYTVIHYQQNVDNDNYTEVERETKQGLTKSVVPDVAKTTYSGFYSLLYEHPAIAANGSTIVEVYYDRYYYLMNFKLGGGTGVEPVYVRYGTGIGTVPNPTRAGYNFARWVDEDGNTVSIPETMPAGNVTYTAIWTPGTANYSVVYWIENADSADANDPDNYSAVHVESVQNVPTESTVTSDSRPDLATLNYNKEIVEDLKHFTRYTNTSGEMQSSYTVEGDSSTIVNVYYKRNEYTVRFYYARKGTDNGAVYEISSSDNPRRLGNVGSWEKGTSTAPAIKEKYRSMLGSMTNGNYTYYYMDLTAKYNADIANKWPDILYDERYTIPGTGWWGGDETYVLNSWFMHENSVFYANMGGQKSYKGQYVRMDDAIITNTATNDPFMTDEIDNYCIALWSTSPSEYTVYIYYEAIDGESTEGLTTKLYQNKTYILQRSYVALSNSGRLSPDSLIGVDAVDQEGGEGPGDNGYVVEFYYSRKLVPLTYMSNGAKDLSIEVPYGAKMSRSEYANHVPATTPDDMEFKGWYTTEECVEGTEYDFTTETMPANAVILYAKWVPITYRVEFFGDESVTNKLETHPDQKVFNGDVLGDVDDPANGDYTFVGWFYMEDGVEKAFDFNNMPVTKNMQVYAKWSSNVLKSYFVYFKIAGTDTQIADPITGAALAGTTKTFDAKGGEELYPDYQEGYFPDYRSQSLTLDIEAETLVVTFYYTKAAAVPYTVQYVNKETREPLYEEKVVRDNRKAVVTETFQVISGYMPDAYQKRLVVTPDGDNVLIFYYTADTQHAYYQITHYTQNLDGETWTEYASSQAQGDIDTTYTAESITIDGFTYDQSVEGTVTSGMLTENGLELKLYYVRNVYPYQVRYLEEGSGAQLAEPKNETGKYGQVVSENAIDIAGYTVKEHATQSITIRMENGTEAELNVINFYYTEGEATINYVVVPPAGVEASTVGTVSPATETVKVKSTETAMGSTAAPASEHYEFVGWYSDAECTNEVNDEWVTNGKIVPTKTDELWTNTTYYAKFELCLGDLIIKKTVNKSDFAGGTFTFNVTAADGTVNVTSINIAADSNTGTATVEDLVAGEYTVTETSTTGYTTTMTCGTNTVPGATINGVAVPAGGEATVDVVNTASDMLTIPVIKVWDDKNDMWGLRPDEVTIQLVGKVGEETFAHGLADMKLSVNNEWASEWTDVPKYNNNGSLITYTITETPVDRYTTEITGDAENGFTVTNTLPLYDLTISKQGLSSTDPYASTMYEVEDTGGIDVDMTVAIYGNNSVTIKDLPEGSYSVAELTDWSWRYTSSNDMGGTVTLNEDKTITFSNTRQKTKWLDSDCYAENRFGGSATFYPSVDNTND